MVKRIRICQQCGNLQTGPAAWLPLWRRRGCHHCHAACGQWDSVNAGSTIGIVGLPAAGKSTYIRAMHSELMQQSDRWRVSTSEAAFDFITGHRGAGGSTGETYFVMHVECGDRSRDVLLWDAQGAMYLELAGLVDNAMLNPWKLASRKAALHNALSRCDVLFLVIGAHAWPIDDEGSGVRTYKDEDAGHARLIRGVTKQMPACRRAVVLLAGIDVFCDYPERACDEASRVFRQRFVLSFGALNNAGLIPTVVPLSNLGFAADRSSFARPYRVLEPIERAFGWSEGVGAEQSPDQPNAGDPEERPSLGRVFISYRRDGGSALARLIRTELQRFGWSVFLDVEDLGCGRFDDRLLWEVARANCVVVLLTAGSLDRCQDSKDWLRREVGHAIKKQRGIVPLLDSGFTFGSLDDAPEEIAELARRNGVKYSHVHFEESVRQLDQRLREAMQTATSP